MDIPAEKLCNCVIQHLAIETHSLIKMYFHIIAEYIKIDTVL